MTLVKKESVLDRLHKSLAHTSLDDLVRSRRRSVLVLDTSESMAQALAVGGTRIDALRDVVRLLHEDHPVPLVRFGGYDNAWSTQATVSVLNSANDIPEPEGGTPLHIAINFVHVEGATHIVLVTDGEPDNRTAALEAAGRFGGVIDVFYVGDANGSGASFAQELARVTGGTCNVDDMASAKQLAAGIAGLLGDGGLR